MGGVVDTVTDFAFGGDKNPLTGLVLGKKDPGQAAQSLDFRSEQEKNAQSTALGQYQGLLNKNPSEIADQTIANQQKQLIQNAQDSQMIARQEVAKRGLGNTSMGLSAIISPQTQLGNKLGEVQANKGLLENQIQQQNLNTATSGINSLLGSRMGAFAYQPAQASKGRQGGLAPLIGGAAGAYFGGPAGAQMGMGLGQAATQIG